MDASWFGMGGESSASVSEHSATTLAPVFAAIRHIVDFGSTLPVDAYRKNADNSRVPSTLPLLLRSQNFPGRYGVGQWIGQALYGIATRGNAVGWIVEADGFGFPSVVRWVRSDLWQYVEQEGQWYISGQPVPRERILHIPWIVPAGCTLGMSPIEHYASVARAGLSAQDYADLRRGGGIPPAVLKNTARTLDFDQAGRVSELAAAKFASGKPLALGSDWDLTMPAIPPNHANFIETLKLSANAIASIYGLDPREIGGEASGSLTYSTDESRSLNRANNMRPYIERFEAAINLVLPDRQFVKLNVDATIRTDIKTRVDVIGAQVADGRMSVNEARALEDRTPVPGGDFYNVPAPTADPTTRNGEPS